MAGDEIAKGVRRVVEGHYVVRWTDTNGAHKKNFRRGRDGRTDAAVRRAAVQWKEDREAGRRGGEVPLTIAAQRVTVGDVIERWHAREDVRPSVVAKDKSVFGKWLTPQFRAKPVGSVGRDDIRAIVKKWKAADLSPTTIRSYYTRVAGLFSYAVDEDLLVRSPCRGDLGLPSGGPRRRRPIVTAETVHTIAEALPDAYRPVAYLGALGLRRAEVFGLQVGDLNFPASTLTVRQAATVVAGKLLIGPPKTEKSKRTIQVPADIMAFLGQHLAEQGRQHEPDGYVVQAPKGGPVRADLFRQRVWIPAVIAAGLGEMVEHTDSDGVKTETFAGLGLHDLRHGAVAMMAAAGVPVEVASRRVGHSTITTTADIYGSLPKAADEKAAEALGDLFSEAARASAENRPVASAED